MLANRNSKRIRYIKLNMSLSTQILQTCDRLTCISKWTMTKLEFPKLVTTLGNVFKACIAAATICKRDDVKVASIFANVLHALVGDHYICQAKSAETERQPPSFWTFHQKCLDSQIQCGVSFQLHDLQIPSEKQCRRRTMTN